MTENTLIALSVGIVLNLIILAWKNRRKVKDNEEGYDLGFNNDIDEEHYDLHFDVDSTEEHHDLDNDNDEGGFDSDFSDNDTGSGDD